MLGCRLVLFFVTMRRQIRHMIKHRYIPFSFGKKVGMAPIAELLFMLMRHDSVMGEKCILRKLAGQTASHALCACPNCACQP